MRRSLSLFSLVGFCLWMLPLGAFIKPSQEKTACDGKRAFHMCSMMSGKIRPASSGRVALAAASHFGPGAKSSAAGGDDFLPVSKNFVHASACRMQTASSFFSPYLYSPAPQYPPPKGGPIF